MKEPNRQKRNWKVNDTKTSLLYSDRDPNDFSLNSKFVWDKDKNITKIDFFGKSLNKSKYKICKVEKASERNITIHMITDGREEKTTSTYKCKHKFDVGDKLNFSFKIYEGSNCPKTMVPELDEGTPESKDGCIIVGI